MLPSAEEICFGNKHQIQCMKLFSTNSQVFMLLIIIIELKLTMEFVGDVVFVIELLMVVDVKLFVMEVNIAWLSIELDALTLVTDVRL